MTDLFDHPLEDILRRCSQAAPQPWYPSAFAREHGVLRDQLDPFLDQLRMAGLIRLTEWVPQNGQGYELTPAGVEVLENPRHLNRLRGGEVPIAGSRDRPERPVGPPPGSDWERGEAARMALTQPIRPIVSYLLIAANVGWFLVGTMLALREHIPLNQFLSNSDPRILSQTGAITGSDLYIEGQWYRLLTCCFVHVGLLHLAVNMYSLYVVGPLLEQLWGSWRFAFLYLIAGFAGSCGLLIEQPLAEGAGASGALWGIMGSMATWLFLHRKVLPRPLVSMWQRQLLITFLLNLFITYTIPQISKGAHFGGGIVGLIAAVPMDYLRFGTQSQKIAAVLSLVLIPFFCLGALLRSFREHGDDIERHYRGLQAQAERPLTVSLERTLAQAHQLLVALQPILEVAPTARDPAFVVGALSELAFQRTRLERLRSHLRVARNEKIEHDPATSRAYKRTVGLFINQLGKMLTLFDIIQERLQSGGEWTAQDRQKFRAILQWLANPLNPPLEPIEGGPTI